MRCASEWKIGLVVLAAALAAGTGAAQNVPTAATPAQTGEPTPGEYGLRFTPGMARPLAALMVRHLFKGHYGLPDAKVADAEEKLTRRLMQFAHRIDEPGNELVERYFETMLERKLAGENDSDGFMPSGFGKEFAERLLPILPDFQEFVRGIVQDIRPMLPIKKQFEMGAQMVAFKTFMDGFQETMKQWAAGDVPTNGDPFMAQKLKQRNEKGETQMLAWARHQAQEAVDARRAKQWQTYLAKFKELYAIDAAQSATADSVLREFTEREEQAVSDPDRGNRIYMETLWLRLSYQLPGTWQHPLRVLLEDELATLQSPLDTLEEQFKLRLESIPTQSQRRAAEQRVAALLEEKHLKIAATEPAQ